MTVRALRRRLEITAASTVKNSVLWARSRDMWNRLRFGSNAPRYAEPLNVKIPAHGGLWHLSHVPGPGFSAAVVSGDWEGAAEPVENIANIRFCLLHWRDGLTWEATGAFDRMARLIDRKGSIEGCRTMADVRARYDRLDRIFEQVQREGRLRRTRELEPSRFRARGDPLFHIGPGGGPFFGGYGCHRLAMAMVLELPEVPAQMGCVHRDGLDFLEQYRVLPSA